MPSSELKRLALLMAVNCVRNTVIENYHADGKLSDEEMKVFIQEVANKIYTFLHYTTTKPPEDQAALLSVMSMMYPSNWDQPKLDADFVKSVSLLKKRKNLIKKTVVHRPLSTAPKPTQKAPPQKSRDECPVESEFPRENNPVTVNLASFDCYSTFAAARLPSLEHRR